MLCEKCSQEVEAAVICGRCGNSIIALGEFCYCCGSRLQSSEEPDGASERIAGEKPPDDMDFSTRILCSDGACIGVVNEQGICKVCGKPYAPEG